MSTLPPNRAHIATEARHPASASLDAMDTLAIVTLLAQDQHAAVAAVEACALHIAHFVDAAAAKLANGGRLLYAGAGTSGRLGVLDASECPPTFRSDPSQVVGIMAGGDAALRRSSEGMEDDPNGIAAEFERLAVNERDAFVGIAAGGTTPYVLGALQLAKSRGATTAFLTCSSHTRPAHCDHWLVLETGAEVLTGSTRLKAGTATKIALNAISTAVFVQRGKVFGNLMVDLAATNDKLVDRAIRIYREFFPQDSATEAMHALSQANGALKTAIVMRTHACTLDEANARLREAHGQLRACLQRS